MDECKSAGSLGSRRLGVGVWEYVFNVKNRRA